MKSLKLKELESVRVTIGAQVLMNANVARKEAGIV